MLTKREYENIKDRTLERIQKLLEQEPHLKKHSSILYGGREIVLKELLEHVQEEEQGIDCDAINKALQDGKITVMRSEHGTAIVPGSQKTIYDLMFENVLNNAEYKMQEIARKNYCKDLGKYCGVSTDLALEAAKRIQELMKKHDRGCYVKSDETEKEQWDRLDGHQKCMKAAADVAFKEQKESEQNSPTMFYKFNDKEGPTLDVEKVLLKHESEVMKHRIAIDNLFVRVEGLERIVAKNGYDS